MFILSLLAFFVPFISWSLLYLLFYSFFVFLICFVSNFYPLSFYFILILSLSFCLFVFFHVSYFSSTFSLPLFSFLFSCSFYLFVLFFAGSVFIGSKDTRFSTHGTRDQYHAESRARKLQMRITYDVVENFEHA